MQEGDLRDGDLGNVRRNLNAEKEVNENVKAAAAALKSLGATVEEVSIPIHLVGPALLAPIAVEGSTQNMMLNAGYGVGRNDLYVTSLMDFLRNWQNRANELAETVKLTIMFGTPTSESITVVAIMERQSICVDC